MGKKVFEIHREMRISTIAKAIKALQNGAHSKRDIQRDTGLSWGSCSEIINLLHEKGLLEPVEEANNQQLLGRKTTNYGFVRTDNLFVGMEIRSKRITCSICDFSKTQISLNSYPVKEELTNDNLFDTLKNILLKCLDAANINPLQVVGLFLSVSGAVDSTHQHWLHSPLFPKIDKVDFSAMTNMLPMLCHTAVVHDIQAHALSIMKKHNWQDSHYAFIHVGDTIGLSTYNNGFWTGHRGFAGELGHILYPSIQAQVQCTCGKYNCLETVLSTPAMLEYVNTLFESNYASVEEFGEEILESQDVYQRVLNGMLFMGIITVNLFDPEVLILGGRSLEPFCPLLCQSFEKQLHDMTWLKGPKQIKWYRDSDINSAYGAVLHLADEAVDKYIREALV